MSSKHHADWRLIGVWSLTTCVRLALLFCAGPLSWAPAVQAANKTWTLPIGGSWTEPARWTGGVPTATDSATFNTAGDYTVYFSSVFQDLNDMFFSAGNVTFERLASPATLTILNVSGGRDLTIGGATLNMGESLPVNITVGDDTIINSVGTLNIKAGSFLNTQDLFVNAGGTLSLTSGTITPSGATRIDGSATLSGGAVTTSGIGDILVGDGGTGSLVVSNGADIDNGGGYVGFSANSTGTATVTGSGSRWDCDTTLAIGVSGSGTLLVQNGASASGSFNVIGANPGSTGSVTVTGTDAALRQQSLQVGLSGSATLRVEAGGLLTAAFNVEVATSPGGIGNVTVTGSNSLVEMSGSFDVGGDGPATVTVADNATVIVYPTVEAVPKPGEVRISSVSTVNIGEGALAGTLDAPKLINNGTLNFNHTNAITQAAAISGTGAITKIGAGNTTLTNASAFTGTMTASSGQLILQGSLGAALYAAATGGTIRFDGSTVNMGGADAIRSTGGAVEYSGATVNGGIFRGQLPAAGTHTIVANANNTRFNDVTIQNGADLIQNSGTNFTNVTNGGRLTSNAFLFYDGGINTTSGNIIVNNSFNTRDFTNYGQITVNSGGSLFHKLGNLASGGGSRITVDSGGLINLMDDSELDLNGALLVNNGNISGTVNVNYGSLAKGTGTYGVVNVNTGGVYAPGNSPGISTAAALSFDNTSVMSGAPTLAIELGGTTPGTQYDQLHVTGNLSLGGALAVSLINSFAPVAGQAFDILDWGSLSGTFASINLPTLAGGLNWNTSQLYATGVLSVGLAGDYNNNGVVDGADYVVWRKGLGPTYTQNDYNVWRANFGQPPGSGSGSESGLSELAAVPEPATLWIGLVAAALLWAKRRRG